MAQKIDKQKKFDCNSFSFFMKRVSVFLFAILATMSLAMAAYMPVVSDNFSNRTDGTPINGTHPNLEGSQFTWSSKVNAYQIETADDGNKYLFLNEISPKSQGDFAFLQIKNAGSGTSFLQIGYHYAFSAHLSVYASGPSNPVGYACFGFRGNDNEGASNDLPLLWVTESGDVGLRAGSASNTVSIVNLIPDFNLVDGINLAYFTMVLLEVDSAWRLEAYYESTKIKNTNGTDFYLTLDGSVVNKLGDDDIFLFLNTNLTTANKKGTTLQSGFDNVLFQVNAIPEPSTWALLGVSLLAVVIFRRRKA